MAKGILRVRITALTNTLIAVFALIPNCSQRLSNIAFCCESIIIISAKADVGEFSDVRF